jgi:hypothetical protein
VAEAVKMTAPKQSKAGLAKQLNISRSALYYRLKLPGKDLKLKSEIEQVMAAHKRYGHRRIAIELKINKKRARRVMRLFGLKPKRQRKRPAPGRIATKNLFIPVLNWNWVIRNAIRLWAN